MHNLPTQTGSRLTDQSDLQDAFRLFSQMSDQLDTTYRQLEQRVEQLSRELAAANSEKLKQLAEKEKLADRLEALHAAMPAAVIWVDQFQTILSANQSAQAIFKESIVGKNWQQLLEQNNFKFNGHELNTPDCRIYSYNQGALEAEQGQVIILTDVTLSQELQQSTHRQQRLAELGEMTAGLAHQVRTPLASALISIEHLSHPSVSVEIHTKSVNRIKENLHHLDHLVNDMLLYARDGEFENDRVSIRSLMQDLNEYCLQTNYQNLDVSIQKSASHQADDDAEILVTGSKDALLSVLISLLENASQLTTESTPLEVIVRYEITGNQVLISVIDNGPGLNPAQCEQIFKPFYTTRKNGTGLGLAISQSIIQAHHGRLIAVSEVGKGTEIQIMLNLYSAEKMMLSNSNKKIQEKLLSENKHTSSDCLRVS